LPNGNYPVCARNGEQRSLLVHDDVLTLH
jgi:hypothetical protein